MNGQFKIVFKMCDIACIPLMYTQLRMVPLVICHQAWGQSTRYFGTLVLEYRFFSTRRYSVLLLLKMKVFLTSTYEYFTSTSHPQLI